MVVANSNLATHLVETAEKIYGEQKDVIALDLHPNEPKDLFVKKVSESVESYFETHREPSDGLLILTDLFGSSTTNSVVSYVCSQQLPIEILTGVNLPMVISALVNRHKLNLKELSEKVFSAGLKGIQNAKNILLFHQAV